MIPIAIGTFLFRSGSLGNKIKIAEVSRALGMVCQEISNEFLNKFDS